MEDFEVSDSDNSWYSDSDDFDLHCHLQTILEGLDEMDPL